MSFKMLQVFIFAKMSSNHTIEHFEQEARCTIIRFMLENTSSSRVQAGPRVGFVFNTRCSENHFSFHLRARQSLLNLIRTTRNVRKFTAQMDIQHVLNFKNKA